MQVNYSKTSFSSFITKYPDLIMAFAIVGIILMMIFPLPVFLLDTLLALSISLSVIILLVSVYISKPTEFSVFPTILLISTLFRLALNVATTRNILLHGAEGHVSSLVTAFGHIVVGGNFLVGFVIFIILMVINFVVITKGAGRVAEVAARFTLDAMPGKQMSIDAELNSGHIAVEEAKKRRRDVEKEADFYGSMDGASKFVRGDAIAAIIVTIVNISVGFLVGVLMHGLSPAESASRFVLFAVGDGLISSIPALMISTAAGIIVTRATNEGGQLGQEIFDQVKVHPKVFYITSALIFSLSLIPEFPKIPFFILAGILFFIGKSAEKLVKEKKEIDNEFKETKEREKNNSDLNNMDSLMKVDILSIEVGQNLISLIDPNQDGEIIDRVQGIRRQFAQELGIIIPQLQLKDNFHLAANEYQILLKGNKIAFGQLMPGYYLAMDPGETEGLLIGEVTHDPVYGLSAVWVSGQEKDEAMFKGYTVVNCATVIATHLTKVLREHSAELVTRQDVQYLVDRLRETNPKVVDEVLQNDRLSLGDVVKVMQNLLREEVSVRDFLTLFESLADYCKIIKNTDVLSEQCRKNFGRSIVQKIMYGRNELLVMTFDRVIEDILSGGLVVTENGSSYLNMDAKNAQDILKKLLSGTKSFEIEGAQPVLLLNSKIRAAFQKFSCRYIPNLFVLSYDEIPPDVKVKNIEMIV